MKPGTRETESGVPSIQSSAMGVGVVTLTVGDALNLAAAGF